MYFNSYIDYQVLTEGTDAVVECPAFLGYPSQVFQIYWLRNGQWINYNDSRFIEEDGQLTILDVRPEDAGTYECLLPCPHCELPEYRSITVSVAKKPNSSASLVAPVIVEPENPILVEYGKPLDLTCELVDTKNDVQYSWTIDTDFKQNHLANTTQQLHKDPYKFLGGRYTCRAENQYGYDEELFFVKILGISINLACI